MLEGRLQTRGKEIRSLAFSWDGKQFLSGEEGGTLTLWDARTLKKVRVFRAAEEHVRLARFSPDGTTLAVESLWAGLTLYTVEGNEVRPSTAEVERCQAANVGLLYNPYGALSAVQVFDTRTGKELSRPLRDADAVMAMSYSSDGRSLLTLQWNRVVTCFQGGTRRSTFAVCNHPGDDLERADFSPDGRMLITLIKERDKRAYPSDEVESPAPIIPGKRKLRVWETLTGKVRAEILAPSETICSVFASPDGGHVALVDGYHRIFIWDLATREAHLLRTPFTGQADKEHFIEAVAFAPGSKRIAVSLPDRTVRLFDWPSGKSTAVLRSQAGLIEVLAFSPDGKILLDGGKGGTVRVWRLP